ncbi:MAG: hypothetical protein H6667_20820 [Ardenticatenaceae bacterium]|nr:hypothetical protein [Ardenticatenaceae bacterium]MCB9446452.1 hypothetical protein [Ardenticatenaceae bacterium]
MARLIEEYLQGVPGLEEPDGELALKAMEAQHGIFVERARQIHSFSHLTLQEYFAALYVVENENRGSVERLMLFVADDRWRELFLLTAGMLADATEFFELFLQAVNQMVAEDEQLLARLVWVEEKGARTQLPYKPAASRAFLFYYALDHDRTLPLVDHLLIRKSTFRLTRNHDGTFTITSIPIPSLDLARALDLALTSALDLKRVLANAGITARAIQIAERLGLKEMQAELQKLVVPEADMVDSPEGWQAFTSKWGEILDKYRDDWDPHRKVQLDEKEIELFTQLSKEQVDKLTRYFDANLLLVRCLEVAYVPNRQAIEDRILLPPS